jgi:acetyl esterase/lipase
MRNVLVLLLMVAVSSMYGQTITLKVWPEKIPGTKSSTGYKEFTRMDNGRPRITKVTDPELQIYLPPKEIASGAAVVICPGGGYGVLAIDHEGWDIAKWLNKMGVAGIVLKYRLPSDEIMNDKSVGPLQDVQEAMRIVRRKSHEWNIDPNKIGVMGFSAGGHLAATASTMYMEKVYEPVDASSARPDFSILIYGVLSMQQDITHKGSLENLLGKNSSPERRNHFSNELRINSQSPPAFLVHSMDDKTVPVENSIRYFQMLSKFSIPAEFHAYEKGGHGYGLAVGGATESNWPAACEAWMQRNGWSNR